MSSFDSLDAFVLAASRACCCPLAIFIQIQVQFISDSLLRKWINSFFFPPSLFEIFIYAFALLWSKKEICHLRIINLAWEFLNAFVLGRTWPHFPPRWMLVIIQIKWQRCNLTFFSLGSVFHFSPCIVWFEFHVKDMIWISR